MARGEVVMAGLIGLLAAGWFWLALGLPYMGDFAPGSGFLPLWLAAILFVLVVVFVFRRVRGGALAELETHSVDGSGRRPALVTAGLVACVAVIDWIGFVVAITLYIAFLVRVVEGYRWRTAAMLSLGTSLTLWALFKLWLRVPLPSGPLGF